MDVALAEELVVSSTKISDVEGSNSDQISC